MTLNQRVKNRRESDFKSESKKIRRNLHEIRGIPRKNPMRKTGFARRRPAPALGEIPPWARKPPEKAPLIKKGSFAAGRRQPYAKKTTGARGKILLDKKGYFPPRAAPVRGDAFSPKNLLRNRKNARPTSHQHCAKNATRRNKANPLTGLSMVSANDRSSTSTCVAANPKKNPFKKS